MTSTDHSRRASDQDARARIRTSLDESLIVEAAAGTGKTSELVRRIVAVLQTGRARVDGIVAVTFTRKAAGELKLRLRQEIDRTRLETEHNEERARLERAMVRLEEAHIGTIHSFCADILRERPVEASLQPGFEELDEKEAPRLFGRVFDLWAQETMNDPPSGLRRALARTAGWDSSGTPLERVRNAAWRLIEWRDFPAPWRREAFDREVEIDQLLDRVVALADAVSSCPKPRDPLVAALQPTIDFRTRVERTEAVRDRDYDALEALLCQLVRNLRRDKRKGRGKFASGYSRDQILEERKNLTAELDLFTLHADANLAATLRDELWVLVEHYERAKIRTGKLDFVDLLISTRDMLRDNQTVRNYLQQRFSHIFVDEFQDTDPLQAEIVLLLAADDPAQNQGRQVTPVAGKLFFVGDPKQSIYRFRRADFTLYRSLCQKLVSKNVRLIYLTRSFRSVPDIQRAVNVAFEPEMKGDEIAGQPSYEPLEEYREPISGQPAVVALPVPRPYSHGWNAVTKRAVNESLPQAVGAYVDWLLTESGWQVSDPAGPESRIIPIAPRHIAILFRRFISWGDDVTRDYVHSLEIRNIPHLLWGAKSFHRREEVETVRAALTAIEWPDDELAVYATLKGSLFAIPDSLLVQYRHAMGALHPFRSRGEPMAPEFTPIGGALGILADLHRRRNWQPFVETINELFEATRAHAGFALRPAGNQVLANVYRVSDLARAFETRGGTSFRGFVEQLILEAETEDGTESPVLEEGADGVRIMTVHAAKGLEFPIVILADITANLAGRNPDRYVDPDEGLCAMRILGCSPWELEDHRGEEHLRDQAEGVRIAYVAATRARDVLVVPTVGDGPLDGWTGAMNKALYPPRSEKRRTAMAPGCPDFGDSSVLDRPANLMSHEEHSVRPGLHRSDSGHLDVVWWDPSLLKLDVPGDFGILQEEILTEDKEGRQAVQSAAEYESWGNTRRKRIETGSAPSMTVFTATEPFEDLALKLTAPELVTVKRPEIRPSGRRFGTLIHLILRDAHFDSPRDSLKALVGFYSRTLDATQEETAAAILTVSEALSHPLMDRASSSDEAYREFPVTLKTERGPILEGVIDLLFLENGTWHVLDFKTDADVTSKLEEYETQVSWYTHAMTAITGRPAKGYLFRI